VHREGRFIETAKAFIALLLPVVL